MLQRAFSFSKKFFVIFSKSRHILKSSCRGVSEEVFFLGTQEQKFIMKGEIS